MVFISSMSVFHGLNVLWLFHYFVCLEIPCARVGVDLPGSPGHDLHVHGCTTTRYFKPAITCSCCSWKPRKPCATPTLTAPRPAKFPMYALPMISHDPLLLSLLVFLEGGGGKPRAVALDFFAPQSIIIVHFLRFVI